MAYNFKNLAEVELLGVMPENANVIVEVDGATKRAPKEDGIGKLVSVEALEEVPENATVLAEVNGEIKRVPGSGLGGGMLYDMPDVVVFTVSESVERSSAASPITCNKTFIEVLNLMKNNELRLVVLTGLGEGYMTLPIQTVAPYNSDGDFVLDNTATFIRFHELVMNLSFYLLNDNTVTMEDPLPPS